MLPDPPAPAKIIIPRPTAHPDPRDGSVPPDPPAPAAHPSRAPGPATRKKKPYDAAGAQRRAGRSFGNKKWICEMAEADPRLSTAELAERAGVSEYVVCHALRERDHWLSAEITNPSLTRRKYVVDRGPSRVRGC